MVKLLLGLDAVPSPHDAADALAVAICHIHSCTGVDRRGRGRGALAPRRPPRSRGRSPAGAITVRDRAPEGHARRKDPPAASSSTSAASATTCWCRCPRSTDSASPARAVTLRMHTHVREDVDRALRLRHAARAGSLRAADLDQRHRPEAGAGGAVGDRAGGAGPRDPRAGRRAADADSRRRQEDRRAHRPRAEGSPAAGRQPPTPRRTAPATGDQLRDDLLSALVNLGYQRAVAEKAVDAVAAGAAERARSRTCCSDVAASRMMKCLQCMHRRIACVDRRRRVDDDVQYEAGLRPRTLDEYIGQDRVRENLQVAITAAKQRGEALDHVLLYGPPGLGKTTLAARHRQRARRGRSARPPDRSSRSPAISRRMLTQPAGARSALHRRSPPHERRRSKRSSIRRWRTTSSTS